MLIHERNMSRASEQLKQVCKIGERIELKTRRKMSVPSVR